MRSKINQVVIKNGEAFIEVTGKSHRWDVIISYEEYVELGKPMPGQIIEVNIGVCQEE